ncbi:hypothetical protein OGAPHI_001110 [Ogataea philodendri]|uniref:Prefoldin subunit 2 n=1 Tax=Ogataea philodendri TaxID=1378263 RepID=A0A9P8T9R8_9ASCO|nr:uncharacterized protein OGAPHI_001110 [Ogataea philodendri]KAH3670595.1 hypothetical protein OGAPHI_001110 [Ogataea philodendri]
MSLQAKYDNFQQTIESLNTKIVQLHAQADEHAVVLETLKEVPAERRCYRMIGGSLVELRAGEASKVLAENLQGMKSTTEKLTEELKTQQKQFLDWKEKNNIKIVKAN